MGLSTGVALLFLLPLWGTVLNRAYDRHKKKNYILPIFSKNFPIFLTKFNPINYAPP